MVSCLPSEDGFGEGSPQSIVSLLSDEAAIQRFRRACL